MRAYLAHMIEQRIAAPADDLLTKLVEAEIEGERLTSEEILAFFQVLLVGGTEIRGNNIPCGSLVLPVIGSANRDAKQFPDADQFKIERNPNPHIAFGQGAHFCIGAPLSRLEARIALGAFLARVGSFALAAQGPLPARNALHVHGPARLPIRVEPARFGKVHAANPIA